MVEENDLILFGANKKFIYLGYLSCKTKNKNLAEKLWPYHENNITFDYIYFIKDGQEINIEQDLTIIKAQTGFNYSPDKRLRGCEFHEGKNADSIIEHLRKNNIFLDDKLNIKSIMDTKDKYFYKKRSEDEDFNYNSVPDPTKEDEKEFLESRSPISKENLKEELKKIEDEYKNKPPEERVKIGKILCRNPKIAYLIKERAKYNCEICGCFPFKQKNGNWYAEAHHILELSKSKIDLPSNMICVCPTCHRVIHYGTDEELEKRKKLKS